MQIVVIRDIKTDLFGNPIFVSTVPGAVRSFIDEVNKTDGNPIALHPEDYELMHVGSFDETQCRFDLFDGPKQLAVGSSFIKGR